MREEYNSVLSTPTEAHKISRFGRYRYIVKIEILARSIYRSISSKKWIRWTSGVGVG